MSLDLHGVALRADGVTVSHRLEPAADRPTHAVPSLGVVVAVGRPTAVRWSYGGVSTRLSFGTGDVLVVPPGLAHAAAWDGPLEFLAVALDASVLAEVARDAGPPEPAALRPALGVRDAFLAQAARALAAAAGADRGAAPDGSVWPRPAARLLAASLGRAVAVHVLHTYAARPAPPAMSGLGGPGVGGPGAPALLLPRRVRRVVEYVRASVGAARVGAPGGQSATHAAVRGEVGDVGADDLSLTRLAAVAGVSPSHLARAFRRATGESVHGFVARARLDEAARLLAETRWPVSRVALALGYASPSHFAQAFRRHTGRSPRAHRDAPREGDG